MSIYTKTGDDGTTSLFGDIRILKSDSQVEAYGSVDELSSFLGMVVVMLKKQDEKRFLIDVQRDLYKIMSVLAGTKEDLKPLKIKIKKIEQIIDKNQSRLPKLNRFILPGGTEISAWMQIVRTICRRTERKVIASSKKNEIIIKYLNRLSDLFFVLARSYNQKTELIAS